MTAFYRSFLVTLAAWSAGCDRYANKISHAFDDALEWGGEHRMRWAVSCLLLGAFPAFQDAMLALLLSFVPFLLLFVLIEGLFQRAPLLRAPLFTACLVGYAWLILSQVRWSMLWPF